MKRIAMAVLMVATMGAAGAWAAGGAPDPFHTEREKRDPVIGSIQDAIAKADWKAAQDQARDAIARNPSNADFHNLYAYALRMGPNPAMDLVFRHYNEALRIDPRHLGAHEYLGEAYLMTGNLDKAKEHLKALDGLCFFSCKEYSMLKKAVADYEAARPGK
jgi:tetratricopeptide (TPR) repeat protein